MSPGRLIAYGLGLAAACACSGAGAYFISPSLRLAPDVRVAVLPFDNNSSEPAAPAVMRALAARGFGLRGYAALAPDAVDSILRRNRGQGALSDGAAALAPEAGLLCYGSVDNFTFENLGLAVKKSVKLRLKIISAATGERLFEGEGAAENFRSFPDQAAAKSYYMSQAAGHGGADAASALKREAAAAVEQVLDRLPRR